MLLACLMSCQLIKRKGDSLTHVGQYVCTFAGLQACNASLFSLLTKWEPS
jgi:hypothetical protein